MAGNDIRIGDIKGRVDIGDKVYKVTDRRLLDEAEKSYENDFRRKISVEMSFTAKKRRISGAENEDEKICCFSNRGGQSRAGEKQTSG